ncbi:PREDICTED: serine protease inhibitor dipetalogastin-like [Nicrophorus vespilloides]|uniref:Serine protease inhibitor dipetalogastin-like n=1 Tax=Nicrophorus vespilloides TaxID=110193 RepID=A0ABM1MDA8_NICVS|nr:PREDICTED: serine protease inhibitor dipetalogastin-like [Nicrophorus vespilloides]
MLASIVVLVTIAAGSYAGPDCPPNYNPVCGYDLKTYKNSCYITTPILHYGVCQPLSVRICGSDGVYYGNIAFFNRAARANPNLTIDYTREGCLPGPNVEIDGVCQAVYDPVCGPNGVTYFNSCFYRKIIITPHKNTPFVHLGECGYIVCSGRTFYDAPAAEAAQLKYIVPLSFCLPENPPFNVAQHLIVTPA